MAEGLIYEDGIATFTPGPYDPHGHPRVFDPITDQAFNPINEYEGKAGLPLYTETLLKSGITMVSAMPNEARRLLLPDGRIVSEQYPISNKDRATAMEVSLQSQARTLVSYHLGLDKAEILDESQEVLNLDVLDRNFAEAGTRATALKIFGDISTGGQNIPAEHIPTIISYWHHRYPTKPVILHLEDDNVKRVLDAVEKLPKGDKIPLHIAHVSSEEELRAVITAKEWNMNVTCEATPHHLFATDTEGAKIGGYGCMKPTLKSVNDMQFLRDNIRYVDIIASDCAPHMVSEKEADPPTFGVTNHTVMMPLLFGAVEAGWLTLEEVYEKTVTNPRKRFNIPDDNTTAVFDLGMHRSRVAELEASINPVYGQNIFLKLEELGKHFNLLGHLVMARSGFSEVRQFPRGSNTRANKLRTSLKHLVTVGG